MRLPVISRNTGVAALAVVAVAGAAANWWLLTTPVDITPTVEQAGTPTAAAEPVTLLPVSVSDDLPETVSRPVFSQTRRPPKLEVQAQETVAAAAAKAPDNLELRGIMRNHLQRVSVLIRSNVNLPGNWVRVGEAVDGWVVREIHDDRAIIETNGQRYELQIPYRNRTVAAQ